MGKIIGIDLGTTNSCVTFIDNGEPVVIPNAEGSRTTPSVVAFTKDGERRVGNVAKRQAVTNPENTIFAVKRLMGVAYETEASQLHRDAVPYRVIQSMNGDAWVHAGDHDFSPPEISALILGQMKEAAEAFIGEPVTEAVVTVPAYFDDAQRQATKDAGKIAGLDVKRIINEPTAAALAYGFQKDEGQLIAVYDLGGGTFDISVLEIRDGVFSVKATNGDTHLGGEDFDRKIVQHLAQQFENESGIDLTQDRIALQRLREQAEKAKHELSTSLETDVNLPFIASDANGPKHLEVTIKRSELEIMCSDLVERTLKPCAQALEDAGYSPADINEVILVGGQTRMPLVQKRVTEFFEREPSKEVNPDEVVAVGAALQGGAISGEVSEVLLLDVTPLSLGVETGGGVFTRIIMRNTTIPTERSEIFTTSVDNQPFVPIHVLQGEREMASDNKTLAKFELAPIPPAMRGVPMIEVKFNIDANGIVNVSAIDKGTGQEKTVRVVASGGLNPEQLQEVIAEANKNRDFDSKRKEIAEIRNAAQSLMYTSGRAVEECAELVSSDIIDEVKADIGRLQGLLDVESDAETLKEALQTLEMSAYRIAESMYSDAANEAGTASEAPVPDAED